MMSPMQFALVQLTDPHIGAPWSADPVAALARAVHAIRETLGHAPDALLVSGHIASTPLEAEYTEARTQLEQLGAPLYAIPGNHDDRQLLAATFGLTDATDPASLSYAVALGPMRLVALDSTHEGRAGGQLSAARLEWLDRTLAQDRRTPTLLAMHHPPIVTGLPGMDEIGIPDAERSALGEVVAGHPQVHAIAAGHVHRAIVGALAGVPVITVPSSDVQLALDFVSDELRFVREPPCFAVHLVAGGRLVSHLQPIASGTR
jgi:3',5'-cyclic AMP phosphodiesterase CpdA